MRDVERSRHPEVHQERVAGREIGKQILATPGERSHGTPAQALSELVGKKRPQSGAPYADVLKACAAHGRRQLATDGLDLGQLGHDGYRGWRGLH